MNKFNFKEDNVINYIIKSNMSSFAKLGLLQIVAMLISFCIYNIYSYIIDKVILVDGSSVKKIVSVIVGYLILIGVQSIVSFFNSYFSTVLQLKGEMKVRRIIVDKLMQKNGEYFTAKSGGELFELVLQDVSIVINFVIGNIFTIIGVSFNLVGTLIFLAIINWRNVLIIIAMQVLSYFAQKLIAKGVFVFSKDTRDNMGDYVSSIQDIFENPSEMIMSGLKNDFISRMDEKMVANYKLNKKLTRTSLLGSSMLGIISQLTICVVLGNSAYCIMAGTMSIGKLMTFMNCTKDLMTCFEGVWNISINMSHIGPMYERVNELYLERDVRKNGELLNTLTPQLEFKNITFGYDKERTIYEDFSYTFAYGKNYGIVGRTGEGKSTLVKLIYDLWTPKNGTVKLGGTECKNLPIEQISRYVNYVSAKSIVLQDTIFNNVAFGNGNITREEVREALKKACFWDEVMEMERGVDTMVGDSGSTLSNGQQHRLVLARAFASKKKILILDEPTSALDSNTEKIVMKNFYEEYKDKTLIIITHNEEILNSCDEVLRLSQGRLSAA